MASDKLKEQPEKKRVAYRTVQADLIESQPDNGGLAHWALASPMLIFLAWVWIDLFAHFSPITIYWLDVVLAVVVYLLVIVLPIGVGAFYVVTAVPRLFGHAGWDVQPLEPLSDSEMYTARFQYQTRRRAPNSWGQMWLRAAQGWVYVEIATILIGAVAMIPAYISATEFGFGQ